MERGDETRDMSNKLIAELVRGKQYADQLQELLLIKPFGDEELGLSEELAEKILRSFTDSLAKLNSRTSSSGTRQIGAGDGGLSFQDSGDSKNPHVKYRRGCYKRKRAADSWAIISGRKEDAYAWRKYGQKDILNSKYPRCYFRCTHKYDQGCQATKQVQKMDETSNTYQTTYLGHHTCRLNNITTRAPQIIADSESMVYINNNNPLNSTQAEQAGHYNKQAEHSRQESHSDVTDNKSSTNSALWQDLIASGSSHEVVSSVYNSESNGLQGLDMKIFGSFDDINNHDFHFGEN